MKLKFYVNKKGEKIYTLKEQSPSKAKTKDAHYKFVKIKSIKD